MKKLMLISNSTNAGEEYLSWPQSYIKEFLEKYKVKKVLFVPYAGVSMSWDNYTTKVRNVFKKLGVEVESVHETATPPEAVKVAQAIVIGGGNTFNLVYHLHKTGLMQSIASRVNEGTPYLGWSAGANVAGPTLMTTNDMPIIQPESFNCMSLVPFQINPHYLDGHPKGHGGETREQRILEFLEINREIHVAALREGTLLEIEGPSVVLKGKLACRVFHFGKIAMESIPGSKLDFLLI